VLFSEKSAADAALALKFTGTGSGTENATATIDHPATYIRFIFLLERQKWKTQI
jgi:hypothetical protein